MAYSSIAEILNDAEMKQTDLARLIMESDLLESGLTKQESLERMKHMWNVMKETSELYASKDRSNSGYAGGDGGLMQEAVHNGTSYLSGYASEVAVEALKTAERNACMKRIVAAPTAGSCGVLPAVLLPLYRNHIFQEDEILNALYVAAGFGQVCAEKWTLAGAEGGCQAEIGIASGMAAAALVYLKGGSNRTISEAFALALTNLEGLVCDPVAGYVELPCIKRNVIGALNAVSSADLALAGITGHIPADEVIEALAEVGTLMHVNLRETGIGGIAGTPTGRRIAEDIREKQ